MTAEEAVRARLALAVTHVVALLWVLDHHWLALRLSAEESAAVEAARQFVQAQPPDA